MPDYIDDPKIARSGGILPRVEPGGGAKVRPKYETTVIGKRPSQVVPDARATSPQQRGTDIPGADESRPTPVERGLASAIPPGNRPAKRPTIAARGTHPRERGTGGRGTGPRLVAGKRPPRRKHPPAPNRETKSDWIEALAAILGANEKSALVSILDLIPLKPKSEFSTKLLKHYVEGSGTLFDLNDNGGVPRDWQDWIVKKFGRRAGLHKEVDPYNVGLYDLQNSLGHFDLRVTRDKSGTTTYKITDIYRFGFKKGDRQAFHGFPLGAITSPSVIKTINTLLPEKEYWNPGGFKEHWEVRQEPIKKTGAVQTILHIPQQFLVEEGKPFLVRGSFIR